MDQSQSPSMTATNVDMVDDTCPLMTTDILEVMVRTMLEAALPTATMFLFIMMLTIDLVLTPKVPDTMITKGDTTMVR